MYKQKEFTMKELPSKPSPLARLFGIDKLGFYNPRLNNYEITFTPTQDQVDFFGSTHDGLIAFLLNESATMLIYFTHGFKKAIVQDQLVRFFYPIPPNQTIKITVTIQSIREKEINITGEIKLKGKIMANMWSKCSLIQE